MVELAVFLLGKTAIFICFSCDVPPSELHPFGSTGGTGGFLAQSYQHMKVQTKRKLLSECNLWCIVSLPPKVFVNAGAASKTNLLFFTKGEATEEIWYYDLSDLNITKRQPLTIAHFEEFFKLLSIPKRGVSERSWCVPIEEIEAKNYDLKAVNPNRKEKEDTRTPQELLSIIESCTEEIKDAMALLRRRGV